MGGAAARRPALRLKRAAAPADAVRVGVALAVPERADRPGWLERVLVLGICAGLLVAVATIDERAAGREAARAHEVIAERAQRAAERSSREAMTAPTASASARTERLGRESPIVIAAGPALGPATSVVSEQQAAAPAPGAVLRRVQGPRVPDALSAIPEPAPAAASAPAAAPAPVLPAPAATARHDDGPLMLMLMAALGLSRAGGGLRLISRRSA